MERLKIDSGFLQNFFRSSRVTMVRFLNIAHANCERTVTALWRQQRCGRLNP